MTITADMIQWIIYIVIIIAIIIFIVKKAIYVAITLGVILLLFNIGFRYDGSDIIQKLGLGQYLKPETSTTLSSFFDDFSQKREQYGIVDADKVYNGMTNTIKTGEYIVVNGIGKIDINKFSKTLATNIYNSGIKNIDFNQLVTEIQEKLSLTKEQATPIAKLVQENYQTIQDNNK